MTGWTILHTMPVTLLEDNGLFYPVRVEGVLTIEEDSFGRQRARVTDGLSSRAVDVAWAWAQVQEATS